MHKKEVVEDIGVSYNFENVHFLLVFNSHMGTSNIEAYTVAVSKYLSHVNNEIVFF